MAWDWYSSPDVYNRDLPLLQELNVNTIRTYKWRNNISHKAFLDECYARGIYVIVGFSWNWNDFNGGSAGRQRMRESKRNIFFEEKNFKLFFTKV